MVDLLVAMGYGGNNEDAAQVTQTSRDDDVYGVIKEDKLGLDKIYVQAKKWSNVVKESEIRSFVGALEPLGASKGVFITTSSYTRDAKRYAADLSTKKIVLIDGKQLTSLMIEYNLGVSVKKAYVVKRIDTDYFEDSE